MACGPILRTEMLGFQVWFLSHLTSWKVIIAPDVTEIKKASKIIIAPEASFQSQVRLN